jgi:predicted AAA+ superfamily ATPase
MEKQKCVMQGFTILRDMLASYIERELSLEYGSDNWWRDGVIKILRDEQKRNLPQNGDTTTLANSLDIANCLLLFDLHWKTIFQKKLSIDHRTWAKELVGFRNRMAHMGGVDFSDSDTWRALDTMSRLAEQIDPETTENLHILLRTFRYGSENGSTTMLSTSIAISEKTKNTSGLPAYLPPQGLLSWRDVIAPHPDVAQGRYKNAEFAADLAQVARGDGALEYRDPVEFFARTFVTEGMTGLLTQALRRVCGKDGEPVIQLKTAFGGGKTHSMLALYHMMRGTVHVDKIPNVKPVLERVGITTLPKTNVAVIVGTALDPTKSKRPKNMPGVTINTIWGDIAAQLAELTNNPDLYDLVRESDRKGVSPGSETLKKLFDVAAPCLVLMDELVAYAKKLYGVKDLPAGTFDNFIAFIQEVTEAARASKNSLVVASIPESNIEIGGEAGKIVLDAIAHTFGRMESIWKPVTANEGFEVVRRRLFLSCKNPNARDEVCAAFSRMYNENSTDFPIETKELDYKKRMVSCYPIHPEVFDELYTNWSTLERFQRTRGVLRLMAAVVYDLWMNNDTGLMIMPGSIPLAVPNVRDELTRHLSDNWNGIVDKEVDGKDSIPYKTDEKERRYGRQRAARRVARTIMLGSAPTGREQAIRGIETSRIRLGIVQPGENIAEFNDALNTLRNTLTFLYTNPSGDRYWYDSRQSLRKTAEDRTQQISSSDVEYEIEKRLHKLNKEQTFAGVHICPASSLDVPDDQTARLVILRPVSEHRANNSNSSAMNTIAEILNNRGNTPRIYRNMLAFIASDQDLMSSLKQEVRWYLAWKYIKDNREDLNLDVAQNRETDNNLVRSNETVDTQLKEVYCWLLVPHIDRAVDIKTIIWDSIRLSGGSESIVAKAAKKMLQDEALISQWAPSLLLMTLNDILWRDSNHITLKQLWEHLCTYCYLPRLTNEKVLEDTIRRGVNSTEYFALAASFDGTRYIDLKFNQQVNIIEHSNCLVKTNIAQKQLTEEATQQQTEMTTQTRNNTNTYMPLRTDQTTTTNYLISETAETKSTPDESNSENTKNTHFYMSAQLDTTRIGRDVQKLVEEIINHLTAVDDTQVEVTLELNVKSQKGLPKEVVRTISENCNTLRIKDYGFDE